VDWTLLAEANRVIGQLSPGKRESVREVVVNAANRGALDDRARRFLDRVTGSSLVSELLVAVIAETESRTTESDSRGTGELAGLRQAGIESGTKPS